MIINAHFCDLSLSRLSEVPVVDVPCTLNIFDYSCVHTDESDSLYSYVFAPRADGFPSSDLSIDAEKLRDPSVSQFVSDSLRQIHHPVGLSPDSDSALSIVRSRYESADAYISRMTEFVDKLNSGNSDSVNSN